MPAIGCIQLLKNRVLPAVEVPQARLNKLLSEMDANEFNTRERATTERQRLAAEAEEPLRAALTGTTSADTRKRLQQVLDTLDTPTPDRLRQLRSVEVLAEAFALLRKLASGAAGARLSGDAKTSLVRCGQE
jgi:hypothetical protein